METFLIKALQLILSLSILVIVHEFGHFLFARLFKIRVEKFYLFFDAGFALFRYKPKNSDTEYGIGWLPLGGYVKISGMIDESMDKEQMAQPPKPYEFRSKPAWQRLLVMIGGVTFNIILAIIIYAMIVFAWGDNYIAFEDYKQGMTYSEVAKSAGLQDGDILISADGEQLKSRGDKTQFMNTYMLFAKTKQLQIKRDGELKNLDMPVDFADQLIASHELAFSPIIPAVIDSIIPNSEARRCGLVKGDSIVKVNETLVTDFNELRESIGNNKGTEVKILFYRNNQPLIATANVDTTGVIGFTAAIPEVRHVKYNLLSSFPAGIVLAKETLIGYIGQIKFVFSKEGVKNLGGPIAIGNMFGATWNWQSFWFMTAFLSVVLAVMNLLPIPGLDGGHVMFLLYEVITRRKPSDKFMEYAQMVGMGFLLLLMVYVFGNDIYRLFIK